MRGLLAIAFVSLLIFGCLGLSIYRCQDGSSVSSPDLCPVSEETPSGAATPPPARTPMPAPTPTHAPSATPAHTAAPTATPVPTPTHAPFNTPTPGPTPYCEPQYCRQGYFHGECSYAGQAAGCACRVTYLCAFGTCNAAGDECATLPTPVPTPTPGPRCYSGGKIGSCPCTIDLPGSYSLDAGLHSAGTCITITASDVTLDCSGNTITGSRTGQSAGILVSNADRVTVRDCEVSSFHYGIELGSAEGALLSGNEITNSAGYAIFMHSASGSTVSHNIVSGNWMGIWLQVANGNSITGNTVTTSGNSIYITGSRGNTISGNIASSNSLGIRLVSSSDNTVSDNTASSNGIGVELDDSDGNRVIGNSISSSSDIGITTSSANGNTFSHNILSHNANQGISVSGTGNAFEANTVTGSRHDFICGSSTEANSDQGGNACATNSGCTWLTSCP